MKIRNFTILRIVSLLFVPIGGLYIIFRLSVLFDIHANLLPDYIFFALLLILAFLIPIDKFKVWVVVILLFATAILRFWHFAIALVACLVLHVIKVYILVLLESLSTFYIDERGLTFRHLYRKDIFIAWEEFNHIGVGEVLNPFTEWFGFLLYFSKTPLKKIHYFDSDIRRQTQEHFFIHYKKGLLEEVLKHVGEERIKDVERIKNSWNPCGNQKPSLSTYKREGIVKKIAKKWRSK